MTYGTKIKKFRLDDTYIYISMGWVQVTSCVTLNNVTSPNNLLLNQCFENPTFELHILYVIYMHANFHINWMLFNS